MLNRLLGTALAVALALAIPAAAQAYPIMGVIWGPATPGPQLANVAVPFGRLTPAGRGTVSLNSADVSTFGFHFNGLDLWNGDTSHEPVSYHIQDTTSTGGYTPGTHFNVGGGCGVASATVTAAAMITPAPCAAGVTAGLNKGPYTFSIYGTDALGNQSATKTLTYCTTNAVSPCTGFADPSVASNMGDQSADATSGAFPSTWTSGTTPAGAAIWVSVGADWAGGPTGKPASTRLIWNTVNWNKPVTFQWADLARPGGLREIEITATNDLTVSGITITGPVTPTGGAGFLVTKTSSNIVLLNDAATHNPTDETSNNGVTGNGPADQAPALNIVGGNGIMVANFTVKYWPYCANIIGTYLNPVSNVTTEQLDCRYIYDNFLSVGNVTNLTQLDTIMLAPMRKDEIHVDCDQVSNSQVPVNYTVKRMFCGQADGTATTQAPIFGGRAGIDMGYVTNNGTVNTLTLTSAHAVGFGAGGNGIDIGDAGEATGEPVFSTTDGSGNSIASGTQVITACGPLTTQRSCTLSGPLQTVGSAASPVEVYTGPWPNLQVTDVFYASGQNNALVLPGVSGTSFFTDFSILKSNGYENGQDLAAEYFSGTVVQHTVGSVSYNVVSATSFDTANSNDVGIYLSTRLEYPSVHGARCNMFATTNFPANCTGPANSLTTYGIDYLGHSFGLAVSGVSVTGDLGFAGTYVFGGSPPAPSLGTPAAAPMASSDDYPVNEGPFSDLLDTDLPGMWSGTFNLSSGFIWDDIAYLTVGRTTGSLPSSVSLIHVAQGLLALDGYSYTHGVAANDFASGDPQAIYDAIPTATWKGQTDEQAALTYAASAFPRSAGDCDAGGGASYCAFVPDANGNPVWNHTAFAGTISSGSNSLTVTSGTTPPQYARISGPGFATPVQILSESGAVLTLSGNSSANETAASGYGIAP